jgi:hypothetical protein
MTSQESKDTVEGEATVVLNNATVVLNFESVDDDSPDGPITFKGVTFEPLNPCAEEPLLRPPERPPCILGEIDFTTIKSKKQLQNFLYGLTGQTVCGDTDSIFVKDISARFIPDDVLIERFDNLTAELVNLGEAIFGFDPVDDDGEEECECTPGCCSQLQQNMKYNYDEDSFEFKVCEALDMVEEVLLSDRAPQYRRQPAEYVPMSMMIEQLGLKVVRAKEAISDDKQIDEMRDVAGYALLMLARMIRGDFIEHPSNE